MSSKTKRFATVLFAFAAAVCLTLALVYAMPLAASADEGVITASLTEDDLQINDGVITAIKEEGNEKIANSAYFTLTISSAKSIADAQTAEEGVFYNQPKLAAINITSSEFTEIGDYAFAMSKISYNDALKEITIPQSVTKIGSLAFANRANLNTINYYATDCAPFGDTQNVTSAVISATAAKNPFYQAGISSREGLTVNIGSTTGTAVNIPAFMFVAPNSAYKNNITAVNLVNVESIGGYAFYNCENIKTLLIESNLTSIGTCAFYGCKLLDSVTLPESVTSIGDGAFYNCSALAQIEIPGSVETLGDSVFRNCTALKTVRLNEGLKSIGTSGSNALTNTFYQCTALESVNIPDSVTVIAQNSFSGCANLKTVEIGSESALKTIGTAAFNGCSSLTTVIIPAQVTSVGNSAYAGCTAVTGIQYHAKSANNFPSSSGTHPFGSTGSRGTGIEVEIKGTEADKITKIPDNMFYYGGNLNVTKVDFAYVETGDTDFGASAFANCTNLSTVTFENCSISKIGNYAFYNCQSLSNFELPDGITAIGNNAFQNCKSLLTITLPSTLAGDGIGDRAFNGCERLIEVRDNRADSTLTPGSTAQGEVARYAFSVVKNGEQPSLKVQNGLYFIYQNNQYYLIGADSTLTDVELPRYVPDTDNARYDIYAQAFRNLNNLKYVKIPSTVGEIGDYAFYQCEGLTTVVIENGVNEIGRSVFDGCSSLADVTLPEGLTAVSSDLFNGCTSLKTITIPESVEEIGSYAFANTALERVTIPSNVVMINNSAFEGCANLHSVEFACKGEGEDKTYSLTSIGAYTFQNCTSLKVISIPFTVNYIGDEAFSGAANLITVYLPDSAEYRYGVFNGCSADLVLISKDSDSYLTDSALLGTERLTYIVDVNLVYGAYTQDNPDVVEKLYNFDFSYELQSDLSWKNTGSATPVQEGYLRSIWYAEESLENVLDANAINALLRGSDRIVLYAENVAPPQLTVGYLSYEHFYIYEDLPQDGLYIGNENLADMLVLLFGYNAEDVTDEVVAALADKYVFALTSYKPFVGNANLTDYVKDAGIYTIEVTLNSAYGEWAEAHCIEFTVERWIVNLSDPNELSWVIKTDNGTQELNSEKIWVPVSGSGVPYIAVEDKTIPEGYEEKYIEKSVTRYNGNEWVLTVSGSSINKYNVTYGNTKGSDIGIYTATATITPTNNFVLGSGTGITDYGITCRPQANGSYIVEKVWYIVAMANELWADGDSNQKYEITGWTYNEENIESKIPSAPKLTYGNGAEANLITFSLTLSIDGNVVELTDKAAYSEYPRWINKAMPAGDYTLTIFVASTETDDDAVATMEEQFAFTVAKAKLDDTVASKFVTAINAALNGKQLSYLSNGDVRVGYEQVQSAIEGVSKAALNPNRSYGAATAWDDDEYDKYYSAFTISYNISTMPYDDYFTLAELESSQYAPREAGAYSVYYQLTALNYEPLASASNRRDYGFGLIIYEVISTSDILTNTLIYSGSTVVPAMSTDKYQVISLAAGETITDEAVIERRFTEEDRNYVDVGTRKVVVKILNPTIYRWQVEGSTGIEVFGDNDEYAAIDFEIIRAVNSTTRALDIIRWSWGSYDSSVNIPIWSTRFGSAEDYSFALVSLSNSRTYTQDSFDEAPAGEYTLRATAAGGTGYNWETFTATATVNILKADNYWDVTPTVYDWLYGEYATRISAPTAIPHFGSASAVSISYYKLNSDGAINSDSYVSLDKLKDEDGEVPVGSYLMVVEVPGSDNYNAMPVTNIPFRVSKTYNSWIEVPFIIGWSENNYNSTDNKLNGGKAQFGEVTIIITDSENNVIDIGDLASLKVGNYTLTAYVEGTDDYYEMQPITTTFAVVEDSVSMTGIIAATIVFAVIAVALAVAAIVLLVFRSRKVEAEFRKMVRTELRRK